MRNYNKVFEQAERIIHRYTQRESNKRSYGNDIMLTQTEIHTIAAIGDEPGIGVKKLALDKGVTEGAISQMIRKLVQKNLITKTVSKESEARVELNLTEQGLVCYQNHIAYHKDRSRNWCAVLDQLSDSNYDALLQLFNQVDTMLENENSLLEIQNSDSKKQN